MKISSNRKIKAAQKRNIVTEAILDSESGKIGLIYRKNFKHHITALLQNRKLFIAGGALVVASFIANILNYVFNTYAERILSFSDFSLIGLIGGFLSVSSIFFGAYMFTVNYRSSYLIGKYDEAAAYHYLLQIREKVKFLSLMLTGIWLMAIPFLMQYFHTNNFYLFIFFAVVLLVGFNSNINQGYLSGKMKFGELALINLTDPSIKLLTTFLLVFIGLKIWVFSAIPTSAFCVFLLTVYLIFRQLPIKKTKAPLTELKYFSNKFFLISLLSGIASVAFFTFDIFLAKHYLSPTDAGRYTLVSLVGKMVFFLGRLASPFAVPFISRHEGAKKNSLQTLYILLACTAGLAFVGFILFGIFGYITVPILYGEKAVSIVPFVSFYTFGMLCYIISNLIVSYYLIRKIYSFTFAQIFLIFVQIGLIVLFHNNVRAITIDMTIVLIANLVATIGMHLAINTVKEFDKKVTSIFGLSEIKIAK